MKFLISTHWSSFIHNSELTHGGPIIDLHQLYIVNNDIYDLVREFLASVMRGTIPPELVKEAKGGEVSIINKINRLFMKIRLSGAC